MWRNSIFFPGQGQAAGLKPDRNRGYSGETEPG